MKAITFLVCCFATTPSGLVNSLDPLELLSTLFFSDCTTIRFWLGLEYGQMNNTSAEPNSSLVNLYLYTENSTTSRSLVGAANELLQNPNFDKTIPVTIYCHGWLQPPGDQSIITVTNALKAKGGQNVLHLDSFALIGNLYLYSSTSLQFIGDALGNELNILVQNGVLRENIHVIGFSMGAHIAGFAGKRFKALNGGLLAHITGLDPAGLCFYNNDGTLRLNSGDAAFVDIIHTNTGAWGTVTPHGHVDFYPNSGDYQPLCLIPHCSHERAWQLYSESILSNQAFPALRCDTWWKYLLGLCKLNPKAYMGYAVDRSTRGVYYLQTKWVSPYGNTRLWNDLQDSVFPPSYNMGLFKTEVHSFLSLKRPSTQHPQDDIALEENYFPQGLLCRVTIKKSDKLSAVKSSVVEMRKFKIHYAMSAYHSVYNKFVFSHPTYSTNSI